MLHGDAGLPAEPAAPRSLQTSLPISGEPGSYLEAEKEGGLETSKHFLQGSQKEAPQEYPVSVPEGFSGMVEFNFLFGNGFFSP